MMLENIFLHFISLLTIIIFSAYNFYFWHDHTGSQSVSNLFHVSASVSNKMFSQFLHDSTFYHLLHLSHFQRFTKSFPACAGVESRESRILVGVHNKGVGVGNAQENIPSIEKGVRLLCCPLDPPLLLLMIKQHPCLVI